MRREPRVSFSALRRGMTLIEVLVALAIVAITLAAGFKAAGGLTVNAQRLTDLTTAQWCAENQLVSLKLNKTWPSVGDSDNQCRQLGRELAGSLQVKSTPNPNFRKVDVVIFDENRNVIVRVSTVAPRF
ncbi:MAG: type secretion system protein GspI [Pseudomonadota bacterium]|jgi:general secretion pathway protein I